MLDQPMGAPLEWRIIKMANVATADDAKTRPMTGEEKKVIFASSLGTVFEWYDFYLYGSLAVYIGATFFSSYP